MAPIEAAILIKTKDLNHKRTPAIMRNAMPRWGLREKLARRPGRNLLIAAFASSPGEPDCVLAKSASWWEIGYRCSGMSSARFLTLRRASRTCCAASIFKCGHPLSPSASEPMTGELTADNLPCNSLGTGFLPLLVCLPRPRTECQRAYLGAGQAAARGHRQR
jgi:hypothetical protein